MPTHLATATRVHDAGDPTDQAPSLLEALAALPDPRHARGVRHQLLVVLVLACCAVLATHSCYVAIAEWVNDSGPAVLDALGWKDLTTRRRRRRVPRESTIRRLLSSIDAPALEAALCSRAAPHRAWPRPAALTPPGACCPAPRRPA